jgi:hypothetical protein
MAKTNPGNFFEDFALDQELRLRTIATRNLPRGDFPLKNEDGSNYHPPVIVDLDYTVLVPA